MTHLSRALLCLLLTATLAPAATKTLPFSVSAGKFDRKDELVRVLFDLPPGNNIASVEILDGKGNVIAVGQAATGRLMAKSGEGAWELYFVLPELKAGATIDLRALIALGSPVRDDTTGLHWDGTPTLFNGKKPVLSYNHPKLDETTPATREATFKVFHELYSPDGSQLVTKGVGGQFTHHRGLFYGFMKATYGTTTVDIWHCKGDTHQADGRIPSKKQGPVFGRHVVAVDWNGQEKHTFAKEMRQLTAFPLPGGTLVEFASRLTPTGEDVKLDGDPQHAGFHFRAANEVAEKTKDKTIFIRPNGAGKPGTEVNWPADKKHVDLPWLGMSFVVGGKRYTAAYLDRPTNPKPARFSERTYERVGSYFVATATKEKPLEVVYRIWLQEGEMTPAEIAAKSRAFVDPVTVTLK